MIPEMLHATAAGIGYLTLLCTAVGVALCLADRARAWVRDYRVMRPLRRQVDAYIAEERRSLAGRDR